MPPKKTLRKLISKAIVLSCLSISAFCFSRRTSNVYSSDSHIANDSIFNADQKNAYGASLTKIEKELEEGKSFNQINSLFEINFLFLLTLD